MSLKEEKKEMSVSMQLNDQVSLTIERPSSSNCKFVFTCEEESTDCQFPWRKLPPLYHCLGKLCREIDRMQQRVNEAKRYIKLTEVTSVSLGQTTIQFTCYTKKKYTDSDSEPIPQVRIWLEIGNIECDDGLVDELLSGMQFDSDMDYFNLRDKRRDRHGDRRDDRHGDRRDDRHGDRRHHNKHSKKPIQEEKQENDNVSFECHPSIIKTLTHKIGILLREKDSNHSEDNSDSSDHHKHRRHSHHRKHKSDDSSGTDSD